MKKRILLTSLLLVIAILPTLAQLTYLTRSTPEEQGLKSKDVLQLLDTLMRQKESDMHGVMILRNGKVVAEKYNEPFAAQYSHTQYSCSKTFTAVAVGLAIEDSLLHLTDRLVDFVPDLLPEVVNDSLAAITVEDLLTMRSGLPVNTKMRTIETGWIKAYLSQKMVALPGTRFAYDSIDTYLLAAMVQKVEGVTVFDLLKKRIFTPMGITQVGWEESPEGITCGGWGLYLQVESMAKFGQLILQRGMWEGTQLVSAEWIDEMTKLHVEGQNYGYQIWMTEYPGMVQANGAWGQYIYILPEKNMVVAMTQCLRGNGKWLNSVVWDLATKATNEALPASKDYNTLKNARYRFTPTKGRSFSKHHLLPLTVQLGNNSLNWTKMEFDFSKQQGQKQPTLKIKVTTKEGETFDLICAYQTWQTNEIKGYPLNIRTFKNNFCGINPPFYVGASYGWTTDDDLYLRLHFVNWISSCRLHFRFIGNSVSVDIVTSDTTKTLGISASQTKLAEVPKK